MPPVIVPHTNRILLAVLLALLALPCIALAQRETAPAEPAPVVADPIPTTTLAAPQPPAEPVKSFLDEPDPEGAAPNVPSMGKALARLVGAMALILALLVGAAVVFKKVMRRGGIKLPGGGDRPLRVIDRLSIGPKQGVVLLNACGRYLVVGVCEREMSVLMEVTPPEDGAEKPFAATLSDAVQPAPAKPAG